MISCRLFTGADGPSFFKYAFKSAFSSYRNTMNSLSSNLPSVVNVGRIDQNRAFFLHNMPGIPPSIGRTESLNPKYFRTTPILAPFRPFGSRNFV